MKSIILVTLENRFPLNKQHFLSLFMIRLVMPRSIISNKPTIYQFGSHIQYLVAGSVASTAFVYTMHITTKVIITVVNAAKKRSTSTRKLSRKKPSLELILALLFPFVHSFLSFLFCICTGLPNHFWGADQCEVIFIIFY